MAYLNADIPPIYCKIRKEYLYDLKKHQGESVDCCVFSVVSITDRALLFNIMLPNGACFWRLPISAFFQEKFDRAEVPDMPIDQLQLWNCFSYYPSVHCFSFLRGKRGKYYGKDKKIIHSNIYLPLIGAIQKETFWIRNILKYPLNISVRIYWLLMTAIMQLSLIIVFCGMLLTTLLVTGFQITQSKLQNGMLKIKTGLQKIVTKCFTK